MNIDTQAVGVHTVVGRFDAYICTQMAKSVVSTNLPWGQGHSRRILRHFSDSITWSQNSGSARFSHRQSSMTTWRFGPFFGLSREGLSPGVRGFFEPSVMKSSSSSRAPWVAGSMGV